MSYYLLQINIMTDYIKQSLKKYNNLVKEFAKCEKICLLNKIYVKVSGKILRKYRKYIGYSQDNREVCPKHIAKMQKTFDPTRVGVIIFAQCIYAKNYKILDGQHRFTIISNAHGKYDDVPFMIEIIKINSDIEFTDHFMTINDNYVFENDQIKGRKKMDNVITQLSSKFSKNKFIGRNRPYIDKETFTEKLANNIFFASSENKASTIVNKIKEINDTLLYSLKVNIVLEGTYGSKGLKISMVNRAQKLEMALGLDREYSWLKLLNTESSNMFKHWKKYVDKHCVKKSVFDKQYVSSSDSDETCYCADSSDLSYD